MRLQPAHGLSCHVVLGLTGEHQSHKHLEAVHLEGAGMGVGKVCVCVCVCVCACVHAHAFDQQCSRVLCVSVSVNGRST